MKSTTLNPLSLIVPCKCHSKLSEEILPPYLYDETPNKAFSGIMVAGFVYTLVLTKRLGFITILENVHSEE